MLFNTPDFIIFFVIVISLLVIIQKRKFQHAILLSASYFFFYYSSNYLIILLIFSTLLDFYIGKEIGNSSNIRKKKILLITSLTGNLGILGFFKYSDFVILQFNILGNNFNLMEQIPELNIILPIGISFYTFQTISYTVDIYRGKLEPIKSLSEFAIFVSFFPQLVAGPILRAKEFLPQLREKTESVRCQHQLRKIIIEPKNLRIGLTIMMFGFIKKMFFADNIAPLVNDIFNNPIGHESFTIILGAIGFGIQIYADFSGYSDIAIGAAMILGFKIPINFNKPYFATSPSDFWRRWHISLSSWLRDYLYIPLGGNKKSKKRTYVNLAIVMFLGGLWHGAAWNFVIWGILHGIYLAIHKSIIDKYPSISKANIFQTKIGKLISICITQYFIFLAWISFRVHDLNDLQYSMLKYILLDFATVKTFEIIMTHKFEFGIICMFVILHYISYKQNIIKIISETKIQYWFIFMLSSILLILSFYDGNPENFIYFQF
jgi:alginate O-acetyltransferase complex protein AlgI